MPKNIVIFSDGTGNSSGKLFRTNVWRIYQAVDLADPQSPKLPRQFAFYDDGVGTSSFRPLAIIGGAFGYGLARNVRDIYAFLCRTYMPGDEIYAFGFSRGAFTIRVLVGMVTSMGLLRHDGDEGKLDSNVKAAYRAFRRENFNKGWTLATLWQGLRDAIRSDAPYEEARKERHKDVGVRFVGLFDTVEAYGLPVDELTRAVNKFVWPLSMPNYVLSGKVQTARQALGLDDERNTFHPRPWDEAGEESVRTAKNPPSPPPPGTPRWRDDGRLSQVWFAGVHSNIGGGYPDDGLAHVPLMWILDEAADAGLRFIPDLVDEYRRQADENGVIYDSRKGLAGYYRYNPRRLSLILDRTKTALKAVKVHESVFRRIAVGHDGYAPLVLPPKFDVVKVNGEMVDGPAYLENLHTASGAADPVGARAGLAALPAATEHVWDHVWRRRVVYFLTLFASLALLLSPLYLDVNPGGGCRSEFCFIVPAVQSVGAVLPGFARTWFEAFASNPGWLIFFAAAILVGNVASALYATWIGTLMRSGWYRIPGLRPKGIQAPLAFRMSPLDRAIRSLRTSGFYQDAMYQLTHAVIPGLFVAAILVGGIVLLSKAALSVSESVGWVCPSTDVPQSPIRTAMFCAPTGADLKAGTRYRIVVELREEWRDLPPRWLAWLGGSGVRAYPQGVLPNDVKFRMTLGVPFRRHWRQPWFKLMARIGRKGSDNYAPHWIREGESNRYGATILARSSGPLMLYVNDATIFVPGLWDSFYSRNAGTALVSVQEVARRASDR